MKNKNIFLVLGLIILVGAGAFYGGMRYQESQPATFSRQGGAGGVGSRQGQGGRTGFRPVNGEIISTDEKTITVKLQDGSSKIVLLSDKTTINKAEVAAKTDLKSGVKVAVFGATNSDGSVTAQNIQLNPLMRR
ncbi:hypothetical protein HZC27_03790 [Candidatus Roizmanbacteria bacterium]|nr:hypothetical protein [Candidatus Roizmanbacteria bacterium]